MEQHTLVLNFAKTSLQSLQSIKTLRLTQHKSSHYYRTQALLEADSHLGSSKDEYCPIPTKTPRSDSQIQFCTRSSHDKTQRCRYLGSEVSARSKQNIHFY